MERACIVKSPNNRRALITFLDKMQWVYRYFLCGEGRGCDFQAKMMD